MKILIAPDSFKGTLSAQEVCARIADAVHSVFPNATTHPFPMADGGEGTVDAYLTAMGGRKVTCTVRDPLFRPIEATYALLNGNTAIIEMAAASGLPLVYDNKNPMLCTSYGTGELITHALDQGVTRILLGLGGSATVDGGAGLLAALGGKLLDAAGHEVPPIGGRLRDIACIDVSALHPSLSACAFTLACDVTNPLLGNNGAAAIFGPQKGATQEMIPELDAGLAHFESLLCAGTAMRFRDKPGSGAAGGLALPLLRYAQCETRPGIDLMLDVTGFDTALGGAALVITGEGCLDGQTASGKVPVGVARRAQRHGVPVVAIVGSTAPGYALTHDMGICAVYDATPAPMPFETLRKRAPEYLSQAAEEALRLIALGMRLQ